MRRSAILVFLWPLLLVASAVGGNESRVADLARRYEIEIVLKGHSYPVKSGTFVIRGADATEEKVAVYLPLLRAELERYPVAFFRKTGLKRFVLCEKLTYGGQKRWGIPDFAHNTMHIDVEVPDEMKGQPRKFIEPWLRAGFHHEMFHVIDVMDDRELYKDAAWAKLNPPEFSYGQGGVAMQNDASSGVLDESRPGFLNRYSTSGVEEDKAEIFAHLITSRGVVVARAKKDPVIAKKVAFMTELLTRFHESALELIAGPGRSVWGSMEFIRARVSVTEADGKRVPSCPELDKAHKDGQPVLLLVVRRSSPKDRGSKRAQIKATKKLADSRFGDAKVRKAAAKWKRIEFDLSDPDHTLLAAQWKVSKAPTILLWRASAEKPEKLSSSTTASRLAKLLEK